MFLFHRIPLSKFQLGWLHESSSDSEEEKSWPASSVSWIKAKCMSKDSTCCQSLKIWNESYSKWTFSTLEQLKSKAVLILIVCIASGVTLVDWMISLLMSCWCPGWFQVSCKLICSIRLWGHLRLFRPNKECRLILFDMPVCENSSCFKQFISFSRYSS
jgi:hypothetical protein